MIDIKNVAIVLPYGQKDIFLQLAHKLNENGARIHLYVRHTNDVPIFASAHPTFDSVSGFGHLEHLTRAKADTVDKAREFERGLGVTYGTIMMADRSLNYGYAMLGPHAPRTRILTSSTYKDCIENINRKLQFWSDEFSAKSITSVVSSVNCPTPAIYMARKSGVAVRLLQTSRIGDLHYWAVDEFLSNPNFASLYLQNPLDSTADFKLPETYSDHKVGSALILAKFQRLRYVQAMLVHILRKLYLRARGHDKGFHFLLRDEVGLMIRQRIAWGRETGAQRARSAELDPDSYVFFPLTLEPEAATMQLSPEFISQHAAITAIARSLPVGRKLVVKEHIPSLGRRPSEFFSQIAQLKNVVLADAGEPGTRFVERCAAVATITGTAGFEAAIIGKPVLSFGSHNHHNLLPHVHLIENLAVLPTLLASIFDGVYDVSANRAAGTRFLAAITQGSFALSELHKNGVGTCSAAGLAAAYDALVSS